MLILSRRQREAITIAGNIEVVVVEIRGNVVRLGVQAPASVPVHRSEIQERIERKELSQ